MLYSVVACSLVMYCVVPLCAFNVQHIAASLLAVCTEQYSIV